MDKELTREEVIQIANQDSPEEIFKSIPSEIRRNVIYEIGRVLTQNDLSLCQAELLLDITKGRLRHYKMRNMSE